MDEYKQVLFCCKHFDIASMENHCNNSSFVITNNLSIKNFTMIINGIKIESVDMVFVIDETVVYSSDSNLFWINKDRFGFGCILYRNNRFVNSFDIIGARSNIINFVNKYFSIQYNLIIGNKLNDIFFSLGDKEKMKSIKSKQENATENTMAMHEFMIHAINQAFKAV